MGTVSIWSSFGLGGIEFISHFCHGPVLPGHDTRWVGKFKPERLWSEKQDRRMTDTESMEAIRNEPAGLLGWQRTLLRFDTWRERHRDLGLSAILAMQAAILFIMVPMAVSGFLNREIVQLLRIGMAGIAVLIVNRNHKFGFAVALVFIAYYVRSGAAGEVVYLLNILITITFDVAVAWIIAVAVFGPGRITIHRIMGAVILYLYVGMIFAALYHLVDAVFYQSFSTITKTRMGSLSEYLYFSMGALTTAGSGTIMPVHPFARSLSMLESVIGQLYPATFIARLVTLHGSILGSDRH
jgi:hypothetical protein